MIYNSLEKTIIKLGYFCSNIRLPFMPLICLLGQAMSLAFIVYPYASFQSTASENQFYFILQVLVAEIRQQLQNYYFQCYAMLFLNLIMLLFWISSFCQQLAEQVSLEEMRMEQKMLHIFYQGIAYFFSLQNTAFIIPTLSVTLHNLEYSIQHQLIFWIVNGCLFLILFVIQSLGQFLLQEGILEIQINTCKKTQLSLLEYIIFFLRYSQAFVFVFIETMDVQYFIYIIITFFEICSIYITKTYVNQNQIFAVIFFNSIGLIICFVSIFVANYPFTYCLLLTPFLFTVATRIYSKQTNAMITKEIQNLNITELDYITIIKFSQQRNNSQFTMIQNSILFSKHIKHCQNIHCSCQNFSNHTNDPTIMMTIPDCILLEDQKKILEMMKKKLCQNSFNFYLHCHLISAQQQFGELHDVYSKIEDSSIRLTIIQRIQWKIFIIIIKNNLFNNLTLRIEGENQEQMILSKKIGKFIQSESFNQSIKDGLINVIQKKIDFQQHLMQGKPLQLNQYYELIKEIQKHEKTLQLIFEKFPSQKNQSQLMFYYGEVMQDWQLAYDQLQTNAFGNNILEPSNDVDINRLTTQMTYIVFSFEERKLQIQSYSKKSPSIFGYDGKMFVNLKQPDILIPRVIREIHNTNIEEFLTQGKGVYFRKKSINICQLQSGFLKNIDFFYDIYFDSNQCFRFICFFGLPEQQDPIILLDQNDKIQGMNKQLFKQLNFNPKVLDQIQFEKTFLQVPANFLFPSTYFASERTNLQNVPFNFPKEQSLLFQPHNSSRIQQFKTDLLNYEVTIEILHRQTYKIIKFKKIQETEQFNKCISIDVQSIYEKLLMNEDVQVLMPYEAGMIASPEDPFLQQVMLETQRRTDVRLQSYFFEEKQLTGKFSKPNIIVHNYSDSEEGESDNKTIQILGNIYKQGQQRDAAFCGGSQASSLAGLRKSHFYRKYSLINQLNNPKNNSITVFKIFWLLTLSIIGQIIFLIININYSTQDFNSLNYYYESIQINHYFIEPMQRFFLTRYMLSDYQIMSILDLMTMSEFSERSKFFMPLLIDTYEEFKQNFQDHFTDKTLSVFIIDQYVTIKQQIYHKSPARLTTYNMTLYNAFNLLLDAFYKQQQTYVTNKIVPGTNPSNTFQYVNYNLFVTIFDKISDNVYKESITQINLVIERWITLLVPTSFIICTFLMLFFQQFIKYNQILENFFDLSRFVEKKETQRDISKQQYILKSLKRGSDLIHKYMFNLNSKEEFLQGTSKKRDQDSDPKKTKNIVKIPQLPLFFSTLFFFIQFALILGPLTYQGVYFMKLYPDTVSLFKSFSDIGVYIPAAFSQKEILYFWEYFSYFTKDDKDFFKVQIEKAVEKITDFQRIQLQKNPLQFSDSFIETLQSLEQNNLCTKLNSSNYYNFDHYCYNSQSGILKLGLMPSLSAFNTILQNDLAIDFPSDRVSPPKDQLEAVFLCSDIITKITQEMQNDISQQSQNLQRIYKIIDPIALAFDFFLLIIIYYIYEVLSLKLHRTKIIAYTFPSKTLFLDDHFERELRRLAISSSLI